MGTYTERYSLRVPLGESAFGSVWTALDGESGAQVAILRLEDDVSDATRERFRDHAKRVMKVAHPNVARAIDQGDTEDGAPYLVIELLEGESLAARWSHTPLTIERAVELVRGAAEGLGALHAAGISHGDVEPGNIFLVGASGHEVAKLIGIALNRATVRGRVLGEPRASLSTMQQAYTYAAPEQLKGEVLDSPSADLYSLGAVLYAALAGRPPHVAPDVDGLIDAIVHTRPPKLATLDRALSSYSATLERALAAEPSKRFQDGVSLARALKVGLAMGRSSAATEIPAGARSPIGEAPAVAQLKSGVGIKKPPSAGHALPKPRVVADAAASTPAFVVPKPAAEAADGAAEAAPQETKVEQPAVESAGSEAPVAGAAPVASEAPVPSETPTDALLPRVSSEELDMSDAREVPPPAPPPPVQASAAKPPPPPPPAASGAVAARSADVHEHGDAHAHGDEHEHGDAHGDAHAHADAHAHGATRRRAAWVVPAGIAAVLLIALGGWAAFGGSGDRHAATAVPEGASAVPAPSAAVVQDTEGAPAPTQLAASADAGVEVVAIVAPEEPAEVPSAIAEAITPRPAPRPAGATTPPRTKRPRRAPPTIARDPGF